VRRKGLDRGFAVLRVLGGQSDGRWFVVEGEGVGAEAGQFGGAEATGARNGVEDCPVETDKAPEVSVALPGGLDDQAQFLQGQRSAIVPAVVSGVPSLHVGQRVVTGAAVLHQPMAESLDLPEVVVRRLGAGSPAQPLLKCNGG